MSFWVYMLRCADNTFYVGHSDNLEVRLAQHDAGLVDGYTRERRPVDLVFSEECVIRDEAFAKERQIKGWSRRKKMALLEGDWAELQRLARAHGPISRGGAPPPGSS
jgi:predicted GIY-YIG superfamily endonuclease